MLEKMAELEEPKFDEERFAAAIAKVKDWDFGLTILKLQEPAYAGWPEARALSAERDYKRYLAVTSALGGFQLVPNGDIDRFWHEHILDTRRYEADCLELFGKPLHHYPFFGMRGETDRAKWQGVIEVSQRLWSRLFNEPLFSKVAPSLASAANQSGEENSMTTINITINISETGARVSVDDGSSAEGLVSGGEIVQINGKNYVLTPAPDEVLAMKCPQACPNEG
jgi:hypothetical protein